MKFWIDACLSPTLEDIANAHDYEATSNRRRGILSALDLKFYPTVIEEDWVFVTANLTDFRALASLHGMHPGLIRIPQRKRELQRKHFEVVLAYIEEHAAAEGEAPRDWMFMREVYYDDKTDKISWDWLPPP